MFSSMRYSDAVLTSEAGSKPEFREVSFPYNCLPGFRVPGQHSSSTCHGEAIAISLGDHRAPRKDSGPTREDISKLGEGKTSRNYYTTNYEQSLWKYYPYDKKAISIL